MKKASKAKDRGKLKIKAVDYFFVIAPMSALSDNRISGNAFRLLCAMYSTVDDTDKKENGREKKFWVCKANRENLMAIACVSDGTYKKCRNELKEAGYIKEAIESVGVATQYTLYNPKKCDIEFEVPEGSKFYNQWKKGLEKHNITEGEVLIDNTGLTSARRTITHNGETFPYDSTAEDKETKTDRVEKHSTGKKTSKTSNVEQKNYQGTGKSKLAIYDGEECICDSEKGISLSTKDLSRKEEVEFSPARKTSNLVNRRPKRKYFKFDYKVFNTNFVKTVSVPVYSDENGEFVRADDFPEYVRQSLQNKKAGKSEYYPDYAHITKRVWNEFNGRVI